MIIKQISHQILLNKQICVTDNQLIVVHSEFRVENKTCILFSVNIIKLKE